MLVIASFEHSFVVMGAILEEDDFLVAIFWNKLKTPSSIIVNISKLAGVEYPHQKGHLQKEPSQPKYFGTFAEGTKSA